MEAVKVDVQIPKNSYLGMKVMGFSTKELIAQELKEAAAIDLFRKKVFSLGKAAELAGMCQADFRELLRKNKISAFDYTQEHWEQDKKSIDKYIGTSK
jgi:predicted HTH domain antitoxin